MSVLIIAWVALLAVCLVSVIRIHFLGKAIRAEIQGTSNKRQEVIADGGSWETVCTIKYPDISQSYKNLKWYKPWERPSTLIVFDKE